MSDKTNKGEEDNDIMEMESDEANTNQEDKDICLLNNATTVASTTGKSLTPTLVKTKAPSTPGNTGRTMAEIRLESAKKKAEEKV